LKRIILNFAFVIFGMLVGLNAIASIDVLPDNYESHGFRVELTKNERWNYRFYFPKQIEIDGVTATSSAVVNVAHDGQIEGAPKESVIIPQYPGMAIVIGKPMGLKETFIVVMYSGEGVQRNYVVPLAVWVEDEL
jgi:hypothetical protein